MMMSTEVSTTLTLITMMTATAKASITRDRPKVKKPKFSEDRRLHIFLTDSTEDRRPKTETEDRRPKPKTKD